MIRKSIIEQQLEQNIKNFPEFDTNLRLETFRKRDYNRVLNEAISMFHEIGKMVGVKTFVKIEEDVRINTNLNKSQIDKLVYSVTNGKKTEDYSTQIPSIYKENYFVSYGKYYMMGLYLEMMPINIFDKSGFKRIMLSPIDSIKVNLKTSRNKDDVVLVSFMGLNLELSEFLVDIQTIDSIETSEKYLRASGFDLDNTIIPFTFREYFETCVFPEYYRKLLYNHIVIIEEENNRSVKPFEQFDTFELISYAVDTIKFQQIKYIDLKHRRLVMGEILFQDLFWFNRDFVLSFYNSTVLQFKQKNFFMRYIYDAFPMTTSTPINYNLYKISQIRKGDGDSSINLKTEWMEYHPSHIRTICPISVSAGHMAKTLYLTQGINIDDKGKLIPTKQSNLLSPQASKTALITSGTISARTQMAQKYFTQAVYSPNCTIPYTGSFNNYVDEISLFNEIAKEDGEVIDETRSLIKVKYQTEKIEIIPIESWKTTDGVNGVILENVLGIGDKFKKGDVIVQYHDPKRFAYRLNKIAFLPFFGYTAEDAIVISEKESKRMISTYSKQVHIPISNSTELYTIVEIGQVLQNELVCSYSYNNTTTSIVEDGVVTSIKYNKIKNTQIEDFMTKIIVDKIIDDTRNEFKDSTFTDDEICEYHSYIKTPPEIVHAKDLKELDKYKGYTHKELILEAKKINVKNQPKNILSSITFDRNVKIDELIGVISIEITSSKVSGVGDKFVTSLSASKGVTAKIIPDEVCPTTADGTPISAFFNPFGFFRRNNWSMVFDGFIGNMIEDIEMKSTYQEKITKIKFLRDRIMKLSINQSQYKLFTNKYIETLVKKNQSKQNWLMVNLEAVDNINFEIIDKIVDDYDKTFGTSISELQEVIIQPKTLQWLKTQGYNVDYLDISKPLVVKCQVLAGSALKLNQVSYHKFNSSDHNVSQNKETGQLHKGRSKQGATSISWLTLSAILGSNFSEENNPKTELYSLFYLKSDASKEEKYKYNSAILTNGKNFNIKKIMNEHRPKPTNAMKMFGSNLALTGLEIV